MPHHHPVAARRTSSIIVAASAMFAAASSLGAQSKVLTPPRPDTASRAAAAAAAAARPTSTTAVPQSAALDSIREVVFRNLLERDRAGFSTLASAFCLGLSNADYKAAPAAWDRADPPEALVRRVSSTRTPARRASTCTFAANIAASRPVPGRALLYVVGTVDRTTDDRAEVAASYNYDGYSAGGYTFSLERTAEGWAVRQWRLEWTGKP